MGPLGRIVTVIEPFRTTRTAASRMAGIIAAFSLTLLAAPIWLAQGQSAPTPATQSAQPPQTPSAQGSTPQGASAQDIEAPTIKIEANEVDLVFTVTDKKAVTSSQA